MKKTQCKEGLDIYKKFLTRMTRISEFLKVAEVCCVGVSLLWPRPRRRLKRDSFSSQQQVGIDRGDIPDLSQVSSAGNTTLFFTASSSYLFLILLYLFVQQ